ncbi:MAG: hypothetical protein IPM12_09900 [Flavobacteriales bacterium]|nr:hypothetical protein [Flavobacteriales bacterium]
MLGADPGFLEPGLRKKLYPLGLELRDYLVAGDRAGQLPIAYADLTRHDGVMPRRGPDGADTLWQTVLYRPADREELDLHLVQTYQRLVADGRRIEHLRIGGVDLCPYGNSQPFRVKVINQINDNHDYFYVKRTDANRVYGLELEHLLSPYRISYLVDGATLVEEHIIGVPGDAFIADPARFGGKLNSVRLCKEFVKFNERCFVRLLGDMRAYNFVVDAIHDVDQVQYRFRAIDLDQQSHDGRLRGYLPQFYKENLPYVQLAQQAIGAATAAQYRSEERALMRKRARLAEGRLNALISAMKTDAIAPVENIRQLADELARHHGDAAYKDLPTMGHLLDRHLHQCLFDPAADDE